MNPKQMCSLTADSFAGYVWPIINASEMMETVHTRPVVETIGGDEEEGYGRHFR
jgi:hypothetical protein